MIALSRRVLLVISSFVAGVVYLWGWIDCLNAQTPESGATLKLEVRDGVRWRPVTLSKIRVPTELLVNCGCESAPSLLAVVGESVVGDAEVQLVVYGGESSPITIPQCPAKVPISGEFGPMRLSGLLEAKVIKIGGRDTVVYSGSLLEAGRKPKDAGIRLTIGNLPGGPTSFCFERAGLTSNAPSSAGNSPSPAPVSGDPRQLSISRFYSEVEAALAQREPFDWYSSSERKDPLGRVVPRLETNSRIQHFAVTVPPCASTWVRTNPFYRGPNCGGTVSVPLSFGPFHLKHTPRLGVPEVTFLGVPGLRHQFSWMLRTNNQVTSTTKFAELWTPSGDVVQLTGVGAEHRPINPAWDISDGLRVYFEGMESLTASATIEGHRLVFRRPTADHRMFYLESISSPSGEWLVRLYGANPSDPTFVELVDELGDQVTYELVRDADRIQLQETKRLLQGQRLGKSSPAKSELRLKRGFPEIIVDRGRITSIRSDRTLGGEALILGIYQGDVGEPIESLREYGYDALGSVMSIYSKNDRTTHREITYVGSSIEIRERVSGQSERYVFSSLSGEHLPTRRDDTDSTLTFTYDSSRWNALQEVTDSRFTVPIFSLKELGSNNLGWKEYETAYLLNAKTSKGGQRTEELTEKSQNGPSSKMTLTEREGGFTRTWTHGRMEASESRSGDSLSQIIKVNGKSIFEQNLTTSVERRADGERRQITFYDRMRDLKMTSDSISTSGSISEEMSVSSAQNLVASISNRILREEGFSLSFSNTTTALGGDVRTFLARLKDAALTTNTVTSVPGAWSLLKTLRRAYSSKTGPVLEEQKVWEPAR